MNHATEFKCRLWHACKKSSSIVWVSATLLTALMILLANTGAGCGQDIPAQPRLPGGSDFKPRTVIPRPFPVIIDAPFMSREDADKSLAESELVLGVVVKGQARAYPINMLTGPRREIINDQLGGHSVAATW